jgi:orotate phosphoribosyltransferase
MDGREFKRDQDCSVDIDVLNNLMVKGHFIYTNGLHGSVYINKDALYSRVVETSMLCKLIAKKFSHSYIEVVAGPAMGGIILSNNVARHLCHMRQEEIFSTYAEKSGNGSFEFKRGYGEILKGKRVLVVEDVINTAGSIKKVIQEVRNVGGHIVGLGALFSRGKDIDLSGISYVPEIFVLKYFDLPSWTKDDCPLCERGVSINNELGRGT